MLSVEFQQTTRHYIAEDTASWCNTGLIIMACVEINYLLCVKDIRKVKIQSPENICKEYFLDSLVAPLQHAFIYFST
jgi:hypothetical protein